MPSTSWVAAATLATASATEIAAGIARRAARVGTVSSGTTSTASTPCGGSRRTGAGSSPTSAPGQSTKPPYRAAATLSGCPSSSTAWR